MRSLAVLHWSRRFAQALLFAILHPYEVVPFIGVFFLGVILAVIYEWRKTLLTPIFVHAMYNCVGLTFVVAATLHNADAPMLGVFGSTSADGALVTTVQPGSAAEKAGIRPGDIIVSYNGRHVTDFDSLVEAVCARDGSARRRTSRFSAMVRQSTSRPRPAGDRGRIERPTGGRPNCGFMPGGSWRIAQVGV